MKEKEKEAAHFELIKDQNKRLLKNLLRGHEWRAKADLAECSNLSFPTVSSLLKEMMEEGEVIEGKQLSSNGGRPAASFMLNPGFRYGVCAILEYQKLKLMLYDANMEACDKTILKDPEGDYRECEEGYLERTLSLEITLEELAEIFVRIKKCCPKLSHVVLGIPGVVYNGMVTHLPIYPNLEHRKLKEYLEEKTDVSFYLGNDVNIMAGAEKYRWPDMMHIFMSECCIGSSIFLNGKLVNGAHGGAGELGMFYREEGWGADDLLHLVRIIQGMLDLPVIIFSGEDIRESHIERLEKDLKKNLPKDRIPEIIYVKDGKNLYKKGLEGILEDEWKEL